MSRLPTTIQILEPTTPEEQAKGRAEHVLMHLTMGHGYADQGKWGLADQAQQAARKALYHVNQDLLTDAVLMQKVLMGSSKLRNRIHWKI